MANNKSVEWRQPQPERIVTGNEKSNALLKNAGDGGH